MSELSYHTQGRLETLKHRTKHCVCKYCGSPLRLKQLIFSQFEEARIEIFCRQCDRIEFGVEEAIYQSAKYFVEQTHFNYYPDLDDTEETKRMNIAKVCEILVWQNKALGFLNENGFTVPLQQTSFMGECLHLTDDDLDAIEVVSADLPSN